MLRKVQLYGELGEKFGRDWTLDINNPVEAIKAIEANISDFRPYMVNSETKGIGYKIIVGKNYLNDLDELYWPVGKQPIKIVPVVLGAKKGLGAILLGVFLIALPFMLPGAFGGMYAPGAAQAIGIAGTGAKGAFVLGGNVFSGTGAWLARASLRLGASLMMQGVSQMLSKPPQDVEPPKDYPSYYFDGPVNTTRQGVPVPLLYGQLVVGGAVISAGLQSEDYVPSDEEE